MAWNDIIDEIRKYTDPEGLVYLQVAQNEVDPVDKALRNGDLKDVVTIIRKLLPYLRSLVPHVNNAGLQKSLTSMGGRAEKFANAFDSGGLTMWALNSFLLSESSNLGNILTALLHAVNGLLKDFGGVVDGLLGSRS